MATREELVIIKAARAGESRAQLALGSRYLCGGNGLPRCCGTAFYWLNRAARQGVDDAWMMIGRNIPYEQIKRMDSAIDAAVWYERAFHAGVARAGLTFARLVLEHAERFDDDTRARAIAVLSLLASRNDHQAQWLLAQQMQRHGVGDAGPTLLIPSSPQLQQHLIAEAAQAGIEQAQYALLERAWENADYATFVGAATPLVYRMFQHNEIAMAQIDREAEVTANVSLSPQQAQLLLRLAQWRLRARQPDLVEVGRMLELAALVGHVEAQLELGLLHARIDRHGHRVFMRHGRGLANFKKALVWLEQAGHGGSALAWHTLARIYSRSIYSQRNLEVATRYLQRAADMGSMDAQCELAQVSWRNRRDHIENDVKAVYWWQRAAQQGHADAARALQVFSMHATAGMPAHAWAQQAVSNITDKLRNANPFICARVELAAVFGLTKPEALLIDARQGDRGHCLVVDICHYYARSKRRLVSIESDAQRLALSRAARLFADVDCSLDGLEGNYRQRQYRLRTSFPEIA